MRLVPSKSRSALSVLAVMGVLALLAVLACGGCMAVFFYGMSRASADMEPEAERLMAAINDGQATDYYQQRTSAEYRQTHSEAEFAQFCERIHNRLGKLKSKTQTGVSVNQTNRTHTNAVTYIAQFERGPATLDFVWTRTGDEPWQLVKFEVESSRLLGDEAAAICPHCQQPTPVDAQFCPHCGKSLAEKPAEIEPPPAEQEGEVKQPPAAEESK